MYFIRRATFSDIPEIKNIFRETIQEVNSKDYSQEKITAWISRGQRRNHWSAFIKNLYFLVALNEENRIVGFSSVSNKGYLYFMYVHKGFQKQGVATLLYKKIEEYLLQKKIKNIITEASITAKPFFEKQGYKTETEQKIKINNLFLTNYKMSKDI